MAVPQLWFLPPEAPDPDLRCLSPQERLWGEPLPQARRTLYWRSRALMRQRLAPLLQMPPEQVPLDSPPGRAPLLAAGCGWVSLSHAAAGVLVGWSPQRLGIDLESAGRRFDAASLLQRFFPELEQRQLGGLAAEPLRLAVLRSWLAKEAAIKCRHRTLAQELVHWWFDHAEGVLRHQRDGTVQQPSEGSLGPWRWACVSDGDERVGTAPLTWPYHDG